MCLAGGRPRISPDFVSSTKHAVTCSSPKVLDLPIPNFVRTTSLISFKVPNGTVVKTAFWVVLNLDWSVSLESGCPCGY